LALKYFAKSSKLNPKNARAAYGVLLAAEKLVKKATGTITSELSEKAQAMLKEMYKIHKIQRVQNKDAFARYAQQRSSDGELAEETVMYHGCKKLSNESGIIDNGFRAKVCGSECGTNPGSWFAYFAPYSHRSYAYHDGQSGKRRLLICVVLKANALLDEGASKPAPDNRFGRHCRVVGPDRAYPQWIVEYTLQASWN